jgi:hypothetical protein
MHVPYIYSNQIVGVDRNLRKSISCEDVVITSYLRVTQNLWLIVFMLIDIERQGLDASNI